MLVETGKEIFCTVLIHWRSTDCCHGSFHESKYYGTLQWCVFSTPSARGVVCGC